MNTSLPEDPLVPVGQRHLILESAFINRGLQIFEDTEPVPIYPSAVLQYQGSIIIIEEALTTVAGGSLPIETHRYRAFFAHIFDKENGECKRSFECKLQELIGLREKDGRRSYRHYKIIQDKLLVHEVLYHGTNFVEHVFDLFGTLLCVLTDDRELESRNPELSVRVAPVPVKGSDYWTLTLEGWGSGRFTALKQGLRYFKSMGEGISHIFYDYEALLNEIFLQEPHAGSWPLPFEIKTLGQFDSIIPDNKGVWMHESGKQILFIPVTSDGPHMLEASERQFDLQCPFILTSLAKGGTNEILFVEFSSLDMEQETIDRFSPNYHVYSYCWLNDDNISLIRDIDLKAILGIQAGIPKEEIHSIDDVSVCGGVVSFSVALAGTKDEYCDDLIVVLNLHTQRIVTFVPMVPRKRAAEGNYPTIVETDSCGRISQILPNIHSQFKTKKATFHVGEVITDRTKSS